MSRSPSWWPPSARSSAPDLTGVAQSTLALLLFTAGARTPLLALLALRRPRNLAVVVLPYAALGLFAIVVADPAAVLLALAPSPLIGARLARLIGAREETVGALQAGTLVLSFPLLATAVPGLAPSLNPTIFAFVIGAAVATAPTIRDAVLPVIDGARYAAVGIILVAAAVAGLSLVDPRAVAIAAGLLVIGAVFAAVPAVVLRGDPLAAMVGGGARDPAYAAGLGIVSGLAGAAAIPLAYAALLALALALGKLLVRREA